MDPCTIALFGEAEKGEYQTAYFCETLFQLVDSLGQPPAESKGLFYAIQAVMYHYNLIFLRVREEGFSQQDYMLGLRLLEQSNLAARAAAIFLPGVGNKEILEAATPLCLVNRSIVITTEGDFYDYITDTA